MHGPSFFIDTDQNIVPYTDRNLRVYWLRSTRPGSTCSFFVAIYGVDSAGCSVVATVDGAQAGCSNPAIIAGGQYAYFARQLSFLSSATANVSWSSEASAVVVMVRAFTMWKAKGGPECWCAGLACMCIVECWYRMCSCYCRCNSCTRSSVLTVMHFRLGHAYLNVVCKVGLAIYPMYIKDVFMLVCCLG